MVSASPLHVAIDVTSVIGPATGVGVFTRTVLDGLARRDDLALTAFAVTWRGRGALADLHRRGIRVVERPMAARPLRALWRRSDLAPVEWWTGAVDVVHGPNFVVPPTRAAAEVVTVHDLTAWRYPDMVDASSRAYPELVARAVRRGAWIHALSHSVAEELRDELDVAAERVVPVLLGASELPPEGPGCDAAAGRRLAGHDRYVLAVGTIEPRKDLPGLVAAFDALAAADRDLALVVAGSRGWGVDAFDAAVAAARHRERIVALGRVEADAHAALLRGAAVVAYPSVYEGFGLVPLEAMAAGVPVVTTRAGAIPEVVADAAELVDPGDRDALSAALDRVLTDEHRRDELVAAGTRRIGELPWSDTVAGLADLYRRAASARG